MDRYQGLFLLLYYVLNVPMSQPIYYTLLELTDLDPRSSTAGKKSSKGRTWILSVDEFVTQAGMLKVMVRLSSPLSPWLSIRFDM